jgi:hypothetical protein
VRPMMTITTSSSTRVKPRVRAVRMAGMEIT